MAITSYTETHSQQADGSYSITARFFDSATGTQHVQVFSLSAANFASLTAILDQKAFILTQNLIDEEVNDFVSKAKEGKIEDTSVAKQSSKTAIDKKVLRALLALRPELGWLDSVDYLDGLSESQLSAAVEEFDSAKAKEVKSAIRNLKNARDILKAYVPPLTAE